MAKMQRDLEINLKHHKPPKMEAFLRKLSHTIRVDPAHPRVGHKFDTIDIPKNPNASEHVGAAASLPSGRSNKDPKDQDASTNLNKTFDTLDAGQEESTRRQSCDLQGQANHSL